MRGTPRPLRAPRRRTVALLACACLLGLLGGLVGQRLASTSTHTTALGDVTLHVRPAAGADRGVGLYVPLADWGLRAQVTGAPLAVDAQARTLNRQALLDAVSGDDRLLEATQRDVVGAVRRALAVSAAGLLTGALFGGLVAMLAWRVAGVRGRRVAGAVAAATLTVTVTAGLVGVWAAVTYRPQRVNQPVYYASGDELRHLLDQAPAIRQGARRYSGQALQAVTSIAGMLNAAGAGSSPGSAAGGSAGRRRVLLASNLHSNVLVSDTLREFAAGGPVVMAGDFTVNGSKPEALLLDGLAGLGRPVIAVSGNHDSWAHMRRLAARGVIVLTHTGRLLPDGTTDGQPVVRVGDLAVAGFEDPLEHPGPSWPDGVRAQLSFTDYPDGEQRAQRALDDMWAWWQALPQRPDVLVVHQAELARGLQRRVLAAEGEQARPLAILAGHTHSQRVDVLGPVTVVDAGTVGAGGPFGAAKDRVSFASLSFDARTLDEIDLVSMNPRDGSASARRVIADQPDCDDHVVFCDAPDDAPDPAAGE